MVTVERRLDPAVHTELRMKFWQSTFETSGYVFVRSGRLRYLPLDRERYTLNTVVEPPHRENVNGLDFHPNSQTVFSCGDDSFKLWQFTNSLILSFHCDFS